MEKILAILGGQQDVRGAEDMFANADLEI